MIRQSIQDVAFQEITIRFPELRGRKILDVGAGSGKLAARLAREGAAVTALDRSLRAQTEDKVNYIAHDLNSGTLPFDHGVFDIVVSTEVLEHLRAPFLILAEMVRVIRQGGILVLTMPNYWNIHYRVRYLLTGNFQRPIIHNNEKRNLYLRGSTPHVNVLTYPILKTILAWEGCTDFVLRHKKVYPWYQIVSFLPFLVFVFTYTWLLSSKDRTQYMMQETNGTSALLGVRHVLLSCVKEVADVRSGQDLS